MSFERKQPDIEKEVNEAEIEKSEKPFLGRIYNSKTARIIALLGVLGIGAKMNDFEGLGEIKFGQTAKEKSEFSQREKSEKRHYFEILTDDKIPAAHSIKRYVVKNAKKTIVHLGQQHGLGNFETLKKFAEKRGSREDVIKKETIDNQKNIEKQILYLKDKYEAKNIFVEGMDINSIKTYDSLKKSIEEAEKNLSVGEYWNILQGSFDEIMADKNLTEEHKSRMGYFIKISMERDLKNLKSYTSIRKNAGNILPPKYAKLFEIWSKNNVNQESVFKYMEEKIKKNDNNEFIKGENIYYWAGAAMKLYMESKINILPAEDQKANEEAFRLFTESNILNEENREKNFKKGNEIRENAALDFISELGGDQQEIIPLVYGKGHDFSNNVSEFSKKGKGNYNLIEVK